MSQITPELYDLITKIIEDKVRDIKVTREEFDKLTSTVRQLAEAQRRTEERLEQLAARVDQLAEAQRRTEEALAGLASQVGRLSDAVGFGLEDIARVMVPGWLELNEGISVGNFERFYVVVDGEEVEVDLFGRGRDGKGEVIVVGECKSRIYRRDVLSFVRKVDAVRRVHPGVRVFSFMFGYLIHPSGDEEAERYGIKLLAPYRIPVRR
nr:hypothetical protein [Candidatus Freyrarchaeum guaymaensis]